MTAGQTIDIKTTWKFNEETVPSDFSITAAGAAGNLTLTHTTGLTSDTMPVLGAEPSNTDDDSEPVIVPDEEDETPDVDPVPTPDTDPVPTPDVDPVPTPDVEPVPTVVISPDETETVFWELQNWASEYEVNRNNGGSDCGGIVHESYFWKHDWSAWAYKSVIKNTCEDKLMKATIKMKIIDWDRIQSNYENYNKEGTVLEQSNQGPSDCEDNSDYWKSRTCTFIVGQFDDFESRDLAQADQSIAGFANGWGDYGLIGSSIAWCGSNDPASC